jgi:hypothetical protein
LCTARSRASSFSSVTLRRSTKEDSDPWEEFRQLEQQMDFGGSPKAMKKTASSPTISKVTRSEISIFTFGEHVF